MKEQIQDLQKKKVWPLVVFYLWLMDEKERYCDEFSLPESKIGGEVFFKKLLSHLKIEEIKPASSRMLSNVFRGKATTLTDQFSQNFQILVARCNIPTKRYLTASLEVLSYSQFKKVVQKARVLTIGRTKILGKPKNGKIEFFENGNAIYEKALELIKNCEFSFKTLINGGIQGKAPEDWMNNVLNLLKQRNLDPASALEFELVILCKEDELKDARIMELIKERQNKFEQFGVSHRIKRRLVVQKEYWLSPDFLIIDNTHLIINWIERFDPHTLSNRTHRGFVLSDSVELIQSFKNFYEKVIWIRGKPFEDFNLI